MAENSILKVIANIAPLEGVIDLVVKIFAINSKIGIGIL